MELFVTGGFSTFESDKNSIIKAAISYHIVKHHQGFVQADCLNDLLPGKFSNFIYCHICCLLKCRVQTNSQFDEFVVN